MSAQQEQTTSEKPASFTMTELTGDYITNLETECVRLCKENSELRIEIESYQLSEKYFKDGNDDDDAKVNYFTGLPSYKALMAIFEFVSPCIEDSRYTLPKFQQFLLVLMKVSLNLDHQLLAFKFGIHVSTVSRCFHKLLNVMYERLKPLVMWPDREELYETMPMEFKKNFGKCVVIIDCFKVFMERPKGLMARAQTWSNYKDHS